MFVTHTKREVLGLLAWMLVSSDAVIGQSAVWQRIEIEGPRPDPRFAFATATDQGSARLYLFGGRDGQQVFGDLWVFDAIGGEFERLEARPGSPRPAPRSGAVLVYDARREGLFLFFGSDGELAYGDSWFLDLPTRWWYEIKPDPRSQPRPRVGAAGVLDEDGDRVVIFGGAPFSEASPDLDGFVGAWGFHPVAGEWRPLPQGPSPRRGAAITLDRTSRDVHLAGGRELRSGKLLQDVWTYDLRWDRWRCQFRDGIDSRVARGDAVIAPSGRGRFVMMLGETVEGEEAGLFEFDVTKRSWRCIDRDVSGLEAPTDRSLFGGCALFENRKGLVGGDLEGFLVYGGLSGLSKENGITPLDDLWLLRFY